MYATTNVTQFVYDGWNLLAEVDAGGAVANWPVWGLDLSGSLQGAGGIGGLLATRIYDARVPTRLFFYDGNGNVTTLTDETGTNITARYEYDPFGRLLSASGESADDNPWRFSTKMYEDDWGLGYWGYRWYSPETGRWMSRDPLKDFGFGVTSGERTGSSTHEVADYAFCRNGPVDHIDRLGLSATGTGGILVWPPSQRCRTACGRWWQGSKGGKDYGITVCFRGRPCSCAFPDVFKAQPPDPAVMQCLLWHERFHLQDKRLSCPPSGNVCEQDVDTDALDPKVPYRPQLECPAIKRALECLARIPKPHDGSWDELHGNQTRAWEKLRCAEWGY